MSNRRRPTHFRRADPHPLSMAAAALRRLQEKLNKREADRLLAAPAQKAGKSAKEPK